MKFLFVFYILIFLTQTACAQNEHLVANELTAANGYFVAKDGHDENPGTQDKPFLTIQAAADVAEPGDVVTVHEGTYRERITPQRGGTSENNRIIYRAAEGEKVTIKGSEVIKEWEEIMPNVWKVALPKSFFGDYNPYTDVIEGDWFEDAGRDHHTGEVYLNGKSFWESATMQRVISPKPRQDLYDPEGSVYTWYTESDEDSTYIYANFHGADPNKELVEINTREAVFYPDTTGIDYITVRGFYLRQAATQWAPPTAEQLGLIGTHWSKGWVIEDNVISDSKCTAVTLGKDRESGHNVWSKNPEIDGATHYNNMIDTVLTMGWSKENIGSHVVRNNEIYNSEQAGIVGSFGAIFSEIKNNDIYNIWTKRQFGGAEMAGIKFHAPIDVIIKGNRITNTSIGIWLDWMTQGTRVTGNLLYDNSIDDLFTEVNHGPYLVDNNIFLSDRAVRDWSKGGAFVHNLIGGDVQMEPHLRQTPYHQPHSTEVVGRDITRGGDNRFFNNIFVATENEMITNEETGLVQSDGLKAYDESELPVIVDNNIYLNGASVHREEQNFLELNHDPEITIEENEDGVYMSLYLGDGVMGFKTRRVSTPILGIAVLPRQRYVNPDGSVLTIDRDYFNEIRDKKNPAAGPIEDIGDGRIDIKVW